MRLDGFTGSTRSEICMCVEKGGGRESIGIDFSMKEATDSFSCALILGLQRTSTMLFLSLANGAELSPPGQGNPRRDTTSRGRVSRQPFLLTSLAVEHAICPAPRWFHFLAVLHDTVYLERQALIPGSDSRSD